MKLRCALCPRSMEDEEYDQHLARFHYTTREKAPPRPIEPKVKRADPWDEIPLFGELEYD